jgi:hypothetical protein
VSFPSLQKHNGTWRLTLTYEATDINMETRYVTYTEEFEVVDAIITDAHVVEGGYHNFFYIDRDDPNHNKVHFSITCQGHYWPDSGLGQWEIYLMVRDLNSSGPWSFHNGDTNHWLGYFDPHTQNGMPQTFEFDGVLTDVTGSYPLAKGFYGFAIALHQTEYDDHVLYTNDNNPYIENTSVTFTSPGAQTEGAWVYYSVAPPPQNYPLADVKCYVFNDANGDLITWADNSTNLVYNTTLMFYPTFDLVNGRTYDFIINPLGDSTEYDKGHRQTWGSPALLTSTYYE